MKRIGVVSDIHSDFQSLCAALDLLESKGAEKVVCAGDLVEGKDDGEGYGDAVVDLIQISMIPCVKGNHEEGAISHAQWVKAHPLAVQALLDANMPLGTTLSCSTIEYLKTLPFTLSYLFEGNRILITHAGLDAKDEKLLSVGIMDFCKKMASKVEADIVIFGHTHEPAAVCYEGIHFFNPGSVCHHRERDSHTCGLITLADGSFEVYNIETGILE